MARPRGPDKRHVVVLTQTPDLKGHPFVRPLRAAGLSPKDIGRPLSPSPDTPDTAVSLLLNVSVANLRAFILLVQAVVSDTVSRYCRAYKWWRRFYHPVLSYFGGRRVSVCTEMRSDPSANIWCSLFLITRYCCSILECSGLDGKTVRINKGRTSIFSFTTTLPHLPTICVFPGLSGLLSSLLSSIEKHLFWQMMKDFRSKRSIFFLSGSIFFSNLLLCQTETEICSVNRAEQSWCSAK